MIELKHTPGPWRVAGSVSDDMVDVDCDGGGCEGATVTGDNAAANARLMAASPDLLEACQAALAAIDNHAQVTGAVLWVEPPYQGAAVHESVAERLMNVIEDATTDR